MSVNRFTVGSEVVLTLLVKDADGAAVDPLSVDLTYEAPDGTTGILDDVQNPAVGTYETRLVPDSAGDWRWTAETQQPRGAHTRVFSAEDA